MDANEQRALLDLIGRYWDLAYAEGKAGRATDTEDGAAQSCLSEIQSRIAALAQQVPADGEVKAWLIRADNGMAIKCVMSEQERDALLFRGESSQFPEWTATPLVEAATPQAPQPVVDVNGFEAPLASIRSLVSALQYRAICDVFREHAASQGGAK